MFSMNEINKPKSQKMEQEKRKKLKGEGVRT